MSISHPFQARRSARAVKALCKSLCILAFFAASLAGCNGLTPGLGKATGKVPATSIPQTPGAAALPAGNSPTGTTPAEGPPGAATQAPAAGQQRSTQTSTPQGPVTLTIWVPPEFDPEARTPGGVLLKARLSEFTQRRPGVKIDVRIKATDGPGGLIDSLTTASAAAQLALPDLVALPNEQLETAALKGLLHPYDGLTDAMESSDWYEYARQLAHLQNSTFGLPFAGDALALVYRTTAQSTSPTDWPSALTFKDPLIFPAADPQALFTLTQYEAAGGAVRDDQGRPFIDSAALEKVLGFYKEAEASGLMPFWLTQYQNDPQVWEAFLENRSAQVVTWVSRYLGGMLADTNAAPIPTPDGRPFTLATGWVWALATPQIEHRALSAELAEFLTESDFLAKWTEAMGFLPPRPSSLSAWSNTSLQNLVGQLALSARLSPSADVMTSLGPPLEEATIQLLKKQSEPGPAAQAASQGLVAP